MSRFLLLTICFAALSVVGCGTASDEPAPPNATTTSDTKEHVEVSAAVFKERVQNGKLVLAKFGAPWCGPCREVDKELDVLEASNIEQLEIVRINVDDEPELAEELEISAIPVVMLFKNGEEVEQWLGYKEASVFQSSIDANQE